MRIPGIDISAHTIAGLYTSQAQQGHRAERPRVEKIDQLDRHYQLKSRRRFAFQEEQGRVKKNAVIRRFDTYDRKARASDAPLAPGQLFNIRV